MKNLTHGATVALDTKCLLRHLCTGDLKDDIFTSNSCHVRFFLCTTFLKITCDNFLKWHAKFCKFVMFSCWIDVINVILWCHGVVLGTYPKILNLYLDRISQHFPHKVCTKLFYLPNITSHKILYIIFVFPGRSYAWALSCHFVLWYFLCSDEKHVFSFLGTCHNTATWTIDCIYISLWV